MMALRKDGSSKRSASYMPYDSSNSFVRKIANKVTGLVGWRSESPASVISQNNDNSSSATDEDNVSPTPKRLCMRREEDATSFRSIPCSSRGTNELCSPIQPINNVKSVNANNRNQCVFVASTPADVFSSTTVQPHSKHQMRDSNIEDSFDTNESVDMSSTIPQFTVHQRHNVTVPAISRDVSSRVPNIDSDRKTGYSSVSNPLKPSFSVDTFSNSSKRLSMSACENRNASYSSPFYAARTLYGGTSGLFGFDSPSISTLRSASSSRLNLFAPRGQITIQPVSPSPNSGNPDQETISASTRRILDTLEKFCSPVMDAKRIPVSEPKRVDRDAITPQTALSKGRKRKLPSLSHATPRTTDQLRVKRRETMQDSITSARQVISSVAEDTIAAQDSDSSDSTDLDYSILASDTKNSQTYVGKTRRKDENFDHNPPPQLKLPNAVLKITNLPKFDIIDSFTFSKPLLPENLEQNLSEEESEPTVSSAVKVANPVKLQTSSENSTPVSHPTTSVEPSLRGEPAVTPVTTPAPMSSATGSPWGPSFVPAKLSTPKKRITPWMCAVCHLESIEEHCSSCASPRGESTKPVKIPEPSVSQANSTPSTTVTSGWGDKFKAATDTWECKECFVRNASAANKCVACESPKPGAPSTPAAPATLSGDTWKSFSKPTTSSAWSFGIPAKDTIDSAGKPEEHPKPAPLTFGVDKTDSVSSQDSTIKFDGVKSSTSDAAPSAAMTKPNPLFGFNSTSTSSNPLMVNSSDDSLTKTSPTPGFSFGDAGVKVTSPPTYAFGVNKSSSEGTDPGTCNALGMKTPCTDSPASKSEPEKLGFLKKNTSVFNDVSSITNNTKNPLLKSTTDTTIPNDPSPFKIPKMIPPFQTASANKENGDDKEAGNALFNATGSTGAESPSKKKAPAFSSYSSGSSNMFAKLIGRPDPNAPLTNSNATTTAVGSPVTNAFSNSFAPSKMMNDAPSFGMTANKTDTVNANDSSKTSKLFSGSGTFSAPVQQQQQPVTGNSIFGNFGQSKVESQPAGNSTFNSASSTFSFGNNSTGTAQSVSVQQSAAPPFSFNGPKAEGTKFTFGGASNTNFPSSNALNTVGALQLANPLGTTNALSGPGSSQFSFSSPASNDQAKPMNSIFASATPSLANSNSAVPAFGNSVFGNASQSASQTPIGEKKSGGFSFPSPAEFNSPTANNFGGFGNVTAKNQNQSALNSNAAPGTSPYVFGSSIVPSTFNFTGGNSNPTFSDILFKAHSPPILEEMEVDEEDGHFNYHISICWTSTDWCGMDVDEHPRTMKYSFPQRDVGLRVGPGHSAPSPLLRPSPLGQRW